MKTLHVFARGLFLCLVVLCASSQAHAASDTVVVTLGYSGISPEQLQVEVGDVIVFVCGECGGQIDLGFTDAPPGATNPAPASTPIAIDYGSPGFAMTASEVGTYSFRINGGFTGTVTAFPPFHVVTLTSAGPSPNSLTIPVGDEVGFAGLRNGDFYSATITSAPPGSGLSVGMTSEELVGCLEFGFTAKVEGTYTYEVGYNGHTYTGSVSATASPLSSVRDAAPTSGVSMTVTPDPSNGLATIRFTTDRPKDLHLALYDATGKQVRGYDDLKLSAGESSVPLSSAVLPSGEYYLRATDNGAAVATTKVIVAH